MFRKASCFCGGDSKDGDGLNVVIINESQKKELTGFPCWGDFWEPLRPFARHLMTSE